VFILLLLLEKKQNRPIKGQRVIFRVIPEDVIEDLPLEGQGKSLPGRQKSLMMIRHKILV